MNRLQPPDAVINLWFVLMGAWLCRHHSNFWGSRIPLTK